MARDICWLGAQQATHIMHVVDAIADEDSLSLMFADGRVFIAEPLIRPSAESEEIREFRLYAARPDSGYADAERIHAESLNRFVDDLDSEAQ